MNSSQGFLEIGFAVYEDDSESRGESIARMRESTRLVDARYADHRKTLRSAEEKELFEIMLLRCSEYRQTRREVIELLDMGLAVKARALFQDSCVERFADYAAALGKEVEVNATDARVRGERIIRLCYVLQESPLRNLLEPTAKGAGGVRASPCPVRIPRMTGHSALPAIPSAMTRLPLSG